MHTPVYFVVRSFVRSFVGLLIRGCLTYGCTNFFFSALDGLYSTVEYSTVSRSVGGRAGVYRYRYSPTPNHQW